MKSTAAGYLALWFIYFCLYEILDSPFIAALVLFLSLGNCSVSSLAVFNAEEDLKRLNRRTTCLTKTQIH